ncbi:hypothetical protein [Sphingomonas sp. Leaf339]|uniref:hypothetical protein n=1 Tax=Sphingomonas sp. Leaf339 TaxID=1736343 RepID=UPI000A967960|nr:hypothetical protein [Sphingomonas sp. Leaf339]
MSLLIKIDRYLRETGISVSRFGREAVNDPRLIFDLRRGRDPGPEITAKVEAYIADAQA